MDVATVTLIVLIVQAVIYGLMLWVMREANRATRISADAAQKSAEAAVKAVEQSERAISITERAVLLIESVIAEPQIGPTAPYFNSNSVLIFTLKNFGSTVAYDVRAQGQLQYPGGVRELKDVTSCAIAPQGRNEWILQPLFSPSPTLDEQIRIANQKDFVKYNIVVTYKDVFKKSHIYRADGAYVPVLRAFTIVGSTCD
jgi:hypothetical protein